MLGAKEPGFCLAPIAPAKDRVIKLKMIVAQSSHDHLKFSSVFALPGGFTFGGAIAVPSAVGVSARHPAAVTAAGANVMMMENGNGDEGGGGGSGDIKENYKTLEDATGQMNKLEKASSPKLNFLRMHYLLVKIIFKCFRYRYQSRSNFYSVTFNRFYFT